MILTTNTEKLTNTEEKRPCSRAEMSSFVAMPKVDDLTVELLETDPNKYACILMIVSKSDAVKERLNETPSETWHSNHPFALSYLVGKLNPRAQDRENYSEGSFYGSKNVDGIPADKAIDLLKVMLNAGGDIYRKNYYGESVIEMLRQGASGNHFYRTGNEEYTRFVETLFLEKEPEEGIPPEQ